jgi:hypothetical protein
MKFTASLLSLVLVLSVSASAAIMESEPNDTLATADVIVNTGLPFMDMGTDLYLSSATDVDFFAIDLAANNIITASTTPLALPFSTPDTFLGLYDAAGNLLVSDDDSGSGKGSMVYHQVASAGTYYVAVTGAGDSDFNGKIEGTDNGHGKIGRYLLSVTVVPEPATLSLLALAGLGLVARKK